MTAEDLSGVEGEIRWVVGGHWVYTAVSCIS
jgi:hypothetical protein